MLPPCISQLITTFHLVLLSFCHACGRGDPRDRGGMRLFSLGSGPGPGRKTPGLCTEIHPAILLVGR
eukprot:768757-Hanusia_phi.AAC.2